MDQDLKICYLEAKCRVSHAVHIKLDSRSSAAAREQRQRRYVEKMLRSWQAAFRRRLQSSAVQRPVGNKYAPALSEAQSGNASLVPAVRDVLSIPYGYFAMPWVFGNADTASLPIRH
ncbi:predicted protein [Histoplasma capsulatum H143]|uniref:Uncharacterized protein n=1 Tax=Ajellomyces capsulatus (strain H143) TaxID=544712 RepID=C6H431_AJECH|nr:predicted protein [Histoplasma capsulatum H143]